MIELNHILELFMVECVSYKEKVLMKIEHIMDFAKVRGRDLGDSHVGCFVRALGQ